MRSLSVRLCAVLMLWDDVEPTRHDMLDPCGLCGSMIACFMSAFIGFFWNSHPFMPRGKVTQYVAQCRRKEQLWPHVREFADRGITLVTNTLRRLQEASEPCSLYTIHGVRIGTAASMRIRSCCIWRSHAVLMCCCTASVHEFHSTLAELTQTQHRTTPHLLAPSCCMWVLPEPLSLVVRVMSGTHEDLDVTIRMPRGVQGTTRTRARWRR